MSHSNTQIPSSTRLRQGVRRLLSTRVAQTLAFPHGVDNYLQQFNPRWSLQEVRASLVSTRSQTADTVTVTLRPNSNWTGFAAGQYLRVSVEIDGVRRTRCFSPANSAHQRGLIELTCKIGPDSVLSRYLRDRAQPGEVFILSQAEGQFALPEQRPDSFLLISGGSGITPVLSMLRTLTEEGYRGQITFLHYCRSLMDQLYANELQEIAARHGNVRLLRCYAEGEAGELSGLFSAAQLRAAVPDFAQAQTFLCGPPGMMQAVQAVYEAEGLSQSLHLEHFSAAPLVVESENPEGEVRFARSERFATNSGQSLLDQAEAAGLRPESGCRMGICHACTCRKTSGRVRDTRTGQISEAGEADIQICVSVPVGTVTLDI